MICSLVIKISFSFYFPIEFNFRLFRLSLQFTNELLRGCHFLVITNLYMILERTIGIIQNPTKIYLISILEVHVFVYFLKKNYSFEFVRFSCFKLFSLGEKKVLLIKLLHFFPSRILFFGTSKVSLHKSKAQPATCAYYHFVLRFGQIFCSSSRETGGF